MISGSAKDRLGCFNNYISELNNVMLGREGLCATVYYLLLISTIQFLLSLSPQCGHWIADVLVRLFMDYKPDQLIGFASL